MTFLLKKFIVAKVIIDDFSIIVDDFSKNMFIVEDFWNKRAIEKILLENFNIDEFSFEKVNRG